MRTTRHLREALQERFPAWAVTDDQRSVSVTRPTILLSPGQIDRVTTAGKTLSISVQIEVWLLTEIKTPSRIEDALDPNIIKLLAALESDPRFTWDTARRGALDDSHGWTLTVTQVLQTETI